MLLPKEYPLALIYLQFFRVQLKIHQMFYLLWRSEEHTSELQSRGHLVCRFLLEKKKNGKSQRYSKRVTCRRSPFAHCLLDGCWMMARLFLSASRITVRTRCVYRVIAFHLGAG